MGKLFKVLVWGKTAVGKTSLIEQLAYGRVEEKVWSFLILLFCPYLKPFFNFYELAISRND